MSRFKKLNILEITAALGLSVRTVEHHIYLTLQNKQLVLVVVYMQAWNCKKVV